MNILVVAVSDDNYGDTVIRACFNDLIKVVLKNLQISDYNITNMAMSGIDENLIKTQDIIYFAGGGVVKYDYLKFFQYIDDITKIADTNNIPIVFSSVGVESFDEDNEKCIQLKKAISRSCVKSISVRDDLDTLKKYVGETNIPISRVCDPAVWAESVYNVKRNEDSDIIGINVVRNGLFKANKKNWARKEEIDFLLDLKALLDQNNMKYKFFTNGSFLDENFLRDFKATCDIPDEQVILRMNNSQKLVEEISNFKAIVAFRMHASITAYALKIPSVALAWNDKVTFFYDIVGWKDRAFAFDNWSADKIFSKLCEVMQDEPEHSEEYFMSVYEYLYHSVANHFSDKTISPESALMYDFSQVRDATGGGVLSLYNDYDAASKLHHGATHYLSRIRDLEKKNEKISECEAKIKDYKKQLAGYKKELSAYEKRVTSMKAQIDKLNRIFAVRCLNYVKRKKWAISDKLKK